MKIEIESPGKTLLALAIARSAVMARWNELANCSSCKQEVKDRHHQSILDLDILIKQIEENR